MIHPFSVNQWKDQGNDDAVANLKLWSGDLSDTIKDSIRGKGVKLNDWLVSMAAGISYPLWKEACTAYARQLLKSESGSGDINKGVSYLLMTHQVRLTAILQFRPIFSHTMWR